MDIGKQSDKLELETFIYLSEEHELMRLTPSFFNFCLLTISELIFFVFYLDKIKEKQNKQTYDMKDGLIILKKMACIAHPRFFSYGRRMFVCHIRSTHFRFLPFKSSLGVLNLCTFFSYVVTYFSTKYYIRTRIARSRTDYLSLNVA